MNKLKTIKYKTSSGIPSSNGNNSDNSLFDKISKRYSTVRFLRKTTGRKTSAGKQQPVSGSYDMTGRDSDDHKLEIGAPILISKTFIDTDTLDSRDIHLKRQSYSDQSDIYMDANSSTGGANHSSSFGELKFSFYTPETSAKETNGDADNENVYDLPRTNTNKLHIDDSKNFNGIRSKSAVNLHKTELSLCLERTPSLSTVAQQSKQTLGASRTSIDKSVNNLPLVNEYTIPSIANQRTSSKLSLNKNGLNDRSYSYSHDSIAANSSIFDENDPEEEDFDLRSASFQSLEARNLFLSIEELNEITKQINEADEFKPTGEKDLEYCAHRDNLKPSERRITLLRNKNQKLIKMGHKKDKISNAWSDFKTWIGEEKGKIREVVHKHAALQRVGANFKNPPSDANESNDCSDGPEASDSCTNIEVDTKNQSSSSEMSAIVNNSSVNSTNNTNNVPINSINNNSEQINSSGNESSAASTLNRCGSRRVVGAEDIEFNEQMTRSIDSRVKHDVLEVICFLFFFSL